MLFLLNLLTVIPTWIGVIDEPGSPFDGRQKCCSFHGRAEVVFIDEVGRRQELHLFQVLRVQVTAARGSGKRWCVSFVKIYFGLLLKRSMF